MSGPKEESGELWCGRPILSKKDLRRLELDAATNEWHHGHDRGTAEQMAYSSYMNENHARAAGHHLNSMKAANASGSPDDAKRHYDMYALHLKALGHEPHEAVPPEVKKHTEGEHAEGRHSFKGHDADQFLVNTVKKP